uniref:Secreted protein n=1 Tax=Heterorhabditis bacteriophora TaxID=37862 RepID=A0A1I7XKY8_HETBA
MKFKREILKVLTLHLVAMGYPDSEEDEIITLPIKFCLSLMAGKCSCCGIFQDTCCSHRYLFTSMMRFRDHLSQE